MEKEDVYGHKISVAFANRIGNGIRDPDHVPIQLANTTSSGNSDWAIEKVLNMMAQSGSKPFNDRHVREDSPLSKPFGDNSIVAASPVGASNNGFDMLRSYDQSGILPLALTQSRSLWNNDNLFGNQEMNTLPSNNGFSPKDFQPIQSQRMSSFVKPPSPKLYNEMPSIAKNVQPTLQHSQYNNFNSSQNYFNKENASRLFQQQQKNIGRVSPFMLASSSCHGCSSNTSHCRSTSPFPPTAMFQEPSNVRVENRDRNSRYSPKLPIRGRSGNLSPDSDSLISSRLAKDHNIVFRSRSASPLANNRFLAPPSSEHFQHSVELLVTNLDQTLDINEMKKILLCEFGEHVMVLHISMVLQPDSTYKSVIKLQNMQDAQFAISQLQRKRIGYKRILISYTGGGKAPPLNILRAEVAALLSDVPTKKMPLFKFRELFFNRYHRSIGISELYKLNDTVQVVEDNTGRMVSLIPSFRSTPSPVEVDDLHPRLDAEKPFCELHMTLATYRQLNEEAQTGSLLPDVCIPLKVLATKVHTLLDIHQGYLLVNSFGACYQAEFGPLPEAIPEKTNEMDGNVTECCPCVPLEHLISCIPGVEITKSPLGIKRVQWLENRVDPTNRSISPALVGKLMLFSREMSDLLKSQVPRCCIQFSKLIPAYHHHFGRQCRVADYGYTKLIDLMEALPNIVQILGEGHNRLLTLTHSTQLKRFSSDLLRILKSRPSKQINMSEFPEAYKQCMDRSFDIAHYGVCDIGDMLSELSDTIVISQVENDTVIAIPKREQTPEEIERTKKFSIDVFELLRHTPSCSLPFNKFIPSYHHHFGRQCRVSNYGFTKLIELFEAIPDVLEVIGHGEDKVLRLTLEECLKVLTERTVAILNCKMFPKEHVLVKNFLNLYAKHHGHCLRLRDYDCDSVEELLGKISNAVKIEERREGKVVVLVDHCSTDLMGLRIKKILLTESEEELSLETLAKLYEKRFMSYLDLNSAVSFINCELVLKNGKVKLSPVLQIVRDVINLLKPLINCLPVANLEGKFLDQYGYPLHMAKFGFASVSGFLSAFPEYFTFKGRRGKKVVSLATSSFEDSALDSPFILDDDGENCYAELEREILEARSEQSSEVDEEAASLLHKSPLTILNQPIPSCIPSPAISPESQPVTESNLMGFETPYMLNYLDSTESDNRISLQPSLFCGPDLFYPNNSTSNNNYNDRLTYSNQPTDYKRLKMAFDPIPPAEWIASTSILNANAEVFSSRRNSFVNHSSEDLFCGSFMNQDDLGLSQLNLSFDSANSIGCAQIASPSKAVGSSRPIRKLAAHFAKPLSK